MKRLLRRLVDELVTAAVGIGAGFGLGALFVWLWAPPPTPENSSPPAEVGLFVFGLLIGAFPVEAVGREKISESRVRVLHEGGAEDSTTHYARDRKGERPCTYRTLRRGKAKCRACRSVTAGVAGTTKYAAAVTAAHNTVIRVALLIRGPPRQWCLPRSEQSWRPPGPARR
jgi:hypothetical protein